MCINVDASVTVCRVSAGRVFGEIEYTVHDAQGFSSGFFGVSVKYSYKLSAACAAFHTRLHLHSAVRIQPHQRAGLHSEGPLWCHWLRLLVTTWLSHFHPFRRQVTARRLRASTEAHAHRHRKVSIALVGRESKADVHRSMNIMHPLQSL